MTRHAASCTCGALSVVATADPARVSVCYCFACQKRTGSAFGAQARFAEDAVTLAGEASTFVRTGDGGAAITFRFCPTCGDTQSYTVEGFDGWVVVPVGLFGAADFPAPTASVYEDRQAPWLEVHGLIDRMD